MCRNMGRKIRIVAVFLLSKRVAERIALMKYSFISFMDQPPVLLGSKLYLFFKEDGIHYLTVTVLFLDGIYSLRVCIHLDRLQGFCFLNATFCRNFLWTISNITPFSHSFYVTCSRTKYCTFNLLVWKMIYFSTQ